MVTNPKRVSKNWLPDPKLVSEKWLLDPKLVSEKWTPIQNLSVGNGHQYKPALIQIRIKLQRHKVHFLSLMSILHFNARDFKLTLQNN